MYTPTAVSTKKSSLALVQEYTLNFSDGMSTPIHVAKYLRAEVRPRLVVFDKHAPLLTWCKDHNVANAINGGFSLHHGNELLGEIRTNGRKHQSVLFTAPWHARRGSVHISSDGHMKLAPRHHLPIEPDGDLLQTGPLLVHNGLSLIEEGGDPEGISASSHEFDDDWTKERFPRAAIGSNEKYIICVATNGYSRPAERSHNAGLTLSELANIMLQLGAMEALNLDGGSSASLVNDGHLVNHVQAGERDNYQVFPCGRPIPTAIVFEPR